MMQIFKENQGIENNRASIMSNQEPALGRKSLAVIKSDKKQYSPKSDKSIELCKSKTVSDLN